MVYIYNLDVTLSFKLRGGDIHRIYGFGDDGEGRGITCRARRDREEHRRFDDLVSDGDGSDGDDGSA